MPLAILTENQARAFAEEWIAAWNSHEIERILSHYSDDFQMTSPFIVKLACASDGTLMGKAEVARYWRAALLKMPTLSFRLLGVFFSANSLCIHYESVLGLKAVEWLRFDSEHKVTEAVAHYDKIPG